MPAILSVPAVLFASAQVPPLLASVIVATVPEAVSVAEQCENPVGRVIVAPDGTVNPAGNVTVIVPPAARAPLEEVVKPSVHVAVEFAVSGAPEKVTLVGKVAVTVSVPFAL